MYTSARSNANPDLQECIQNCIDCHNICMETLSYCIQMGGMHASSEHLRLLMDCQEICQTSANFMLRNSQFHEYTCAACAAACARCAQECGHMGDDSQMQLCADVCRRCAESCDRMSADMPARA